MIIKSEKESNNINEKEGNKMYMILGFILIALAFTGMAFDIGGPSNYVFLGLGMVVFAVHVLNHVPQQGTLNGEK